MAGYIDSYPKQRLHRIPLSTILLIDAFLWSLLVAGLLFTFKGSLFPLSATEEIDSSGLLTLTEWQELALDDNVEYALALAYSYNVDWRPLAQRAVQHRTRVVVDNGYFAATYNNASNTITVDPSLVNSSPAILAAILAHEVSHANTNYTLGWGAADIFEDEMRASAWAAATYNDIPHTNDGSYFANEMERLVTYWSEGRLREYVLLSPAYQREALGRELPSY